MTLLLFHLAIVALFMSALATALDNTPIYLFNDTLTLLANSSGPAVIILDYEQSFEGIPEFEVLSTRGDTSVLEITYAESKAALGNYMSDGPVQHAAAMDSYRVNRYNISAPGQVTNRLIQGAFRYCKLNLSSPGELILQNVGVTPTIHTTPLTELPGSFESSDETLNRIWLAGAKTIQMTEIPKNSIPDFWQVTEEGALVDSLIPQALGSAELAQATKYNVSFQVKAELGGFAFSVMSDTLNSGIVFSCDIDNQIITVHEGASSENEMIDHFTIPSNVTLDLGAWNEVRVQVAITDIDVFINDSHVIQMTQTSKSYGAFGLGASFGYRAVFKDLEATSPEGEMLYSHPLTDAGFLPDFMMGSNPLDVSIDGSRRDRIAYSGDLDIAVRAALTSTYGLEFLLGALKLLGSYQAEPGFFIPTAKIQQEPLTYILPVNITGLIGYSFNLLNAAAQTHMHTGDTEFAQEWATKATMMLDWAHSQTLQDGIFNLSDSSFGGDWNYYDPPQVGVVAKFNMLYAYALQECQPLLTDAGVNVNVYQERLDNLRQAINRRLWNQDLNAYQFSEDIGSGYGQDSNALAILAGVNTAANHSSEFILSAMSNDLAAPGGSLAFSPGVIEAGFARLISPYASSYHLRAAFASNNDAFASELLNSLWASMADPKNENYTGTFWETLDADGRPGLGLGTSLCHGWSAGPTAELSRYVLGARPEQPGWVSWVVEPRIMDLTFARGRLPTPLGDMEVEWEIVDGLFSLNITAPGGTDGTVIAPKSNNRAKSRFSVDGKVADGHVFKVSGGSTTRILQLD
ncbi:unnamed protein product [Clonostachys solani]|uniref:Alpha-L-rhamnosidase C n=1 Tax=Clonostachys solani TaxID=160281 RepID=A0A9N9VZ61_9HYPO|nr:unnamed protein product [Clonostachys solani]